MDRDEGNLCSTLRQLAGCDAALARATEEVCRILEDRLGFYSAARELAILAKQDRAELAGERRELEAEWGALEEAQQGGQ